jgi:hypothetical protein
VLRADDQQALVEFVCVCSDDDWLDDWLVGWLWYMCSLTDSALCTYIVSATSDQHIVLMDDERNVLRNSDGSLQLLHFELDSSVTFFLRVRMVVSVFWEIAMPELNLRVEYTGSEVQMPDGSTEHSVSFAFSFDSIASSSLDWFLSWFVPVDRARHLICKHFRYTLACGPKHLFSLLPTDAELRGNVLDIRYHIRMPMLSGNLLRLVRMFSHDLMLGDVIRLGTELTYALYQDLAVLTPVSPSTTAQQPTTPTATCSTTLNGSQHPCD